jgi:hypothetical protein
MRIGEFAKTGGENGKSAGKIDKKCGLPPACFVYRSKLTQNPCFFGISFVY